MLIGQQLKQFRLDAGYSQQTLAEQINVSRQVISKWETDKSAPDLNTLVVLAYVYLYKSLLQTYFSLSSFRQ